MTIQSKTGCAVGIAAAGAAALIGVARQQVYKVRLLEDQLSTIEDERDDAQEALRVQTEQAFNQAEQLQQQLAVQATSLTDAKTELETVKQHRSAARQRILGLESEATTAQQKYETEVKRVQGEIKEAKRQAQHHEGRADNLHIELERRSTEWKQAKDGLQIELTRLEQRAVQAEAGMRGQRQQLEKTQAELLTEKETTCDLALELMLEQTDHTFTKASLADATERGEIADRLLAEKKGELQNLQEQVGLLRVQAEEEGRQRAAQALQLEDVRKQLKEHEAVIAVRDAALQGAEDEKLQFKKQLDAMRTEHGKEMSVLKGKLEEQEAVTALGVQTVQQLEADKLELQTELNNNMQKHAQELSLVKGKLEESKAVSVRSLSEIAAAKKVANNLTKALQGELNAAKSSVADKDEELKKLDMQLKEAEAEAARVQASNVEASRVEASKLEDLKAELDAAKGRLADKEEELKKLKKQAKKLRRNHDNVCVEKAKADKELDQVKGKLAAASEGSVVSEELDAAEDLASLQDVQEPQDVAKAGSPSSTHSSPRIAAGRLQESDLDFEAGSCNEGSQDGSSGEGGSTAPLEDEGYQLVRHKRARRPRAQQGHQHQRRRPSGRRGAVRGLDAAGPAPARPAGVAAPLATSTKKVQTSTGGSVLLVAKSK